jgi:hypothetical protein
MAGSSADREVRPRLAAKGQSARICEVAPSVFGSLLPHSAQAGASVGDDRRLVDECQRGLAETQ